MTQRPDPQRWARLRFAVVGALLAAPPPAGQLQQALRKLSEQHWLHPNTGLSVRFGVSTIEAWYYKAKSTSDPMRTLRRQRREDAGRARVFSPAAVAQIHALYIVHERTLAFAAYQNGKQENLWATIEGRLMPMIGFEKDLTLAQLNLLTQVWLEQDYHRNRHSEIATTPLHRFTSARSVGRDAPDSETLRRAFCKRERRKQRRSDGTCSLEGKRFEIPARFGKLESLTLSYARWDLSRVEMIDPDTGVLLSRVYPLDKHANASGVRRARESAQHPVESLHEHSEPVQAPLCAVDEQGMSPLMRKHLRDYALSGMSPGFIPSPENAGSIDSTDHKPTTDQPIS
ncbi:MAG: hypothetical protein AB8B64_27300 [Granulosicoccus sp.]